MVVQYWRSFADLERFARDRDDPHLEPWRRSTGGSRDTGDVGIWHETYRVRTGDIETIYGNMPPHGLAAAVGHGADRRGRDSAAARIGVRRTTTRRCRPTEDRAQGRGSRGPSPATVPATMARPGPRPGHPPVGSDSLLGTNGIARRAHPTRRAQRCRSPGVQHRQHGGGGPRREGAVEGAQQEHRGAARREGTEHPRAGEQRTAPAGAPGLAGAARPAPPGSPRAPGAPTSWVNAPTRLLAMRPPPPGAHARHSHPLRTPRPPPWPRAVPPAYGVLTGAAGQPARASSRARTRSSARLRSASLSCASSGRLRLVAGEAVAGVGVEDVHQRRVEVQLCVIALADP